MLNINWTNSNKEMEKIGLISDEFEKATRLRLIDTVIDKINEYNQHIYDYEYSLKKQEIISRGVAFIPQSNPRTIKSNWSKLFAASVSSDEKRAIGYESYRWHIFSFEKVIALTSSKARRAFNKCKKEKVFVFYQHKDEAFYIENAKLLKSSDFDSDDDIYIFDLFNKWTYVHTHESQCGPYFFRV
nr:DUF4275 family protein [uncultured Anaerosporobacter sp.]